MFPFTLQQLRILKAIATEKNFTKAADLLYLSQPSLSKQIQTLEKNLKVALIHREAKKISFTPNGKVMLQYAERILALSEECCRVLKDLKTAERGQLTIGADPIVGQYFLPKVLPFVVKDYPYLHWKITMTSTSNLIQKIQQKKIDIGLVSEPISEKVKKTVCMEPLMTEEIVVMVHKSHFLLAKESFSKEDLYRLNWIWLNSRSKWREWMEQRFLQNKMDIHQFKVILQLPSMEALQLAVKLGLGAAFVPSSMIDQQLQLENIQFLKIETLNLSQSVFLLKSFPSSKLNSLQCLEMTFSKLQKNLES